MGTSDHYFSASPTARSRPRLVRVGARGQRFELTTDRGVFSPGHLDPGTAFLLEHAPPPPPRGTFLDLGCGYGPIACMLGLVAPDATVHAVDVNERSLDLCRANAVALGLTNVVVEPADVAPRRTYDLIWSNPPIRIGKTALHELVLKWLGQLAPGGLAVLVVGRNLGADSLQDWMTGQGHATSRLASKKGYRLLRVDARGPLAPGSS